MLDQQIAIGELTEFFMGAEKDSGLRSAFGSQLDAKRTGIVFERSFPRTDDKMVALVDRSPQHRSVYQRLRQLPLVYCNILEASYGDLAPIGRTDVSVSLAIGTQLARDAHKASINSAKRRLCAEKGDPKKDKEAVTKTIREWLDWLSGSTDGSRAALLQEILEEGRRIRKLALDAYCATDLKEMSAS